MANSSRHLPPGNEHAGGSAIPTNTNGDNSDKDAAAATGGGDSGAGDQGQQQGGSKSLTRTRRGQTPSKKEPDAVPAAAAVPVDPAKEAFFRALTDADPSIAAMVATGQITTEQLMSLGESHLVRGAAGLKGAQKAAAALRKQYEHEAETQKNIKWAALFAETAAMSLFGYDAMAKFTGMKGGFTSLEAFAGTATNTALSTGLSAFRTGSQFLLMEQAYISMQKGQNVRGAIFGVLGIGMAALHSAFVAMEFSDSIIQRELDKVNAEMAKIASEEAGIRDAIAADRARINAEIAALDTKLGTLAAPGAADDPRLTAINEEIRRLESRQDSIRDNPLYRDGKYEPWDRQAEKDMREITASMERLTNERTALMKSLGEMTPDRQKLIGASTEQRTDLNEKLKTVEDAYKARLEALTTARTFWEQKLNSISPAANPSGWSFLQTPSILVTSFTAGAAISILNWGAAYASVSQREKEAILAGAPDPWGRNTDSADRTDLRLRDQFLGYDVANTKNEVHLRNESLLKELAKAIKNPQAMRSELEAVINEIHGDVVTRVGQGLREGAFTPAEYAERLKAINESYQKALGQLKDPEVVKSVQALLGQFAKDDPDVEFVTEGAQSNEPASAEEEAKALPAVEDKSKPPALPGVKPPEPPSA